MSLDHLWAGWRIPYLEAETRNGDPSGSGPGAGVPRRPPPGEGSLFERILTMSDEDGCIVHRGATCSVLLNAYPYTNGHVLVVPNRAVEHLVDLTTDEHTELWTLVRDAVTAITAAYRCDGVNVGMNVGEAAGAGIPDHLHAHVLPRWRGDTNFMTAVADARVMPEPLHNSWAKLRDAWP